MQRIGIIAGSFKPLHAGHFNLITCAARECDVVMVLASLTDRGSVTGRKMRKVWVDHIVPVLPKNVKLEFCQNPVRRTYEHLGEADKGGSVDTFCIYSAPEDVNKNFSSSGLKKYVGRLFEGSQIVMVPIERAGTLDISGTQVRGYIDRQDRESFISCLPECVDAGAIWNILVDG